MCAWHVLAAGPAEQGPDVLLRGTRRGGLLVAGEEFPACTAGRLSAPSHGNETKRWRHSPAEGRTSDCILAMVGVSGTTLAPLGARGGHELCYRSGFKSKQEQRSRRTC